MRRITIDHIKRATKHCLRTTKRHLGNLLIINQNRVRKRTFVGNPRRLLAIEPTSRCNLSCRFCAYEKLNTDKMSMPQPQFEEVVEQAVAMGFDQFCLTPTVGDVFFDKQILDKIAYLDQHPSINYCRFYTNFCLPNPEQIKTLLNFSVVPEIFISLYGYDHKSFELTTRKPPKQFDKLHQNLEFLNAELHKLERPFQIHFNVRTMLSDTQYLDHDTPFTRTVQSLVTKHGANLKEDLEYDNWAGMIEQSEVDLLNIKLTDGKNLYMHGLCLKVLSHNQVRANGDVEACPCRDMDGSLLLGNINHQPLEELLSMDNPRLRELVLGQQKGDFAPNCRSCAHYRSIYDHRPYRHAETGEVFTLASALDKIQRSPEVVPLTGRGAGGS